MISKYLFPNYFKKVGWVLIIISLVWVISVPFRLIPQLPAKALAIYSSYGKKSSEIKGSEYNDVFDEKSMTTQYQRLVPARKHWFIVGTDDDLLKELAGIILILGSIFVSCSKQKSEDEYISRIRLDSLLWATYVNYSVLILSMLFFFGEDFAGVLILNMFTILIFFLIRFNYVLYKSKKTLINEE